MNPVNTIAEIARQAGVGTATVDRVINGRTGVNPDTAIKVMKIVGELGAAGPRGRPKLATKFRFAFVLPTGEKAFLMALERQIALLAADFRHQQITEVTYRFDASDPSDFANQLSKLTDFDGIALLAPDLPPIKLAINKLVAAGVNVITLFSDVAGSMRASYVGADNRAGGRTAGQLLGHMAGFQSGKSSRNTLLLCSQATRFSGEIERRIGFAQVIEERFPRLHVHRIPDLPDSQEAVQAHMLHYLKGDEVDCSKLCGIYNVAAGTSGLTAAINSLGLTQKIGVVAHDLTDKKSDLLTTGHLSYVLHQDIHYSVMASARVLRALRENLRGGPNVVQARFEILTAENLH